MMTQSKTARERAERALRHMPIMPTAKEGVTVIAAAEIKSAISDTLEEAAKAAENWGTFYPTSVFPEDGTSTDCISAGMGRQAAKQIAADIRRLEDST